MKLIVYFLFPLILSAQTFTVKNPLRFLALGDSYTIGESVAVNERWPVQLKDSLILRGISTETLRIIATTGWRTDNLLNAITGQNLQSVNYNLVSLLIGVNNQFQMKPFTQHKTEFIALLDSAVRYAGGDKNRVIVVSIPDYAYTPYGQTTSNPSAISADLDKYNLYNKHIADSLKIKYFDITPISRQGITNPGYVAADGLHPSGQQYGQWVKLMLQEVDKGILLGARKVEKKSETRISLKPNPFTDKIFINLSQGGEGSYEIMNALGNMINQGILRGTTTEVDLASLPEGIYVIKIQGPDSEMVKRIIKTH